MKLQVPGCTPAAHERQGPAHESVQQTPSTQKPLLHWPGSLQGWPGPFLPQLPALHMTPEAQSRSPVHAPLQAPPAQAKGAQSTSPPDWQLPRPSHLLAEVNNVPPAQRAALHTAPTG
jgi:hypothetical protein